MSYTMLTLLCWTHDQSFDRVKQMFVHINACEYGAVVVVGGGCVAPVSVSFAVHSTS